MTRILEAGDDGTLTIPAELLPEMTPHARYVTKRVTRGIYIQPESDGNATHNLGPDDEPGLSVRSNTWKALAEEVGRKWETPKSAAEVVSELRR